MRNFNRIIGSKSKPFLIVISLLVSIFSCSNIWANTPPTAGNESLSINEDQTPALIGSLLVNNTDVDGDLLTVTNIYSSVSGAFFTNLNNGFINYYTALNFCGVDTIVYYVSDGTTFIADTLFLTINCINDPASLGNESLTVNEDAAATSTLVLLANNTDPENDPLTIISIGTPINGTLIDNGNGTYNYTPNPGYCGTEIISYQVSDGVNITIDYLTIIVICTNDIPDGGNETITILEDANTTNSGYLLANNSDPDGNTLTILNITSSGGGTFVLTPTGSVNYTPNANFCGTDTLVYSVTDGTIIIYDTLFVEVTCVNDIPTGGNELVITNIDTPVLNIDILANDSDVETPILTISSPSFPATTTAGGTVTINTDNTVNYNPPVGFSGYDTLIYTVCDDWVPAPAGCVTDTLFIAVDPDGDGIITDLDSDNDGIPDTVENATAQNGGDTDGDGLPDYLDLDSDNDGIMDIIEAGGADSDGNGMVDNQTDWNMNGYDDNLEANPFAFIDTDNDNLPNFQDVDDDGDGILTIDEYDENNDSIIDDCNGNGIYNYLDAESCVVTIPEVFSPNFDGKNDVFVINGIFAYPESNLSIYNRWGVLIFEAKGYQNNWGGTNEKEQYVRGHELAVGTYFYILDLKDGSDVMKGYIYLTR
jgi:gliding motility-associated-like protein